MCKKWYPPKKLAFHILALSIYNYTCSSEMQFTLGFLIPNLPFATGPLASIQWILKREGREAQESDGTVGIVPRNSSNFQPNGFGSAVGLGIPLNPWIFIPRLSVTSENIYLPFNHGISSAQNTSFLLHKMVPAYAMSQLVPAFRVHSGLNPHSSSVCFNRHVAPILG